MSIVEDFFQGNQQQAKLGLVGSMDDDPESAARSLDLSEATGVPATAISGDLDGFERQHKAALGSSIVANNNHIADYLNSHPMAPRLSHDDLGQLDIASQSISKLHEKSNLQRFHEALQIDKLGTVAFGDDPLKPYKEFGLSRPQDIEYAARNPELASVGIGVASLVGYPFIFAGQILGGATNLINEFGGRQAASMFEYGLMRGDIRSAGTGTLSEYQHIGQSMQAAAPWLRAGKGVPTGIDPMLDKIKTEQAKGDADVLSEALAESIKSATRERNADFYANFARLHLGEKEIGIPAEAIQELYGEKAPVPGDNLLGWVQGIDEKLPSAAATGGDVKISLADWLAKVEPDVAKELQDHIRARPDGITIEEGKLTKEKVVDVSNIEIADSHPEFVELTNSAAEAKKKAAEANSLWQDAIDRDIANRSSGHEFEESARAQDAWRQAERVVDAWKPTKPPTERIITEPHTLVRGSAGLEPMFSVGDRKVKLDRHGVDPTITPQQLAEANGFKLEELSPTERRYYEIQAESIAEQNKPKTGFHDFQLLDETGKTIGSVNLSEQAGGKQLYIEMIQAGKDKRMYDPNFLGPALIRDLLRQLKQEFPNAESITGHRVSGAREKADSFMKPSASPVIKFEDLNQPLNYTKLHDGWQEIQRGVYGKSIEMTPEKQKVVDAVNTVLDRIVPKAVGVEGFEKIRDEAGGKKGGVYSRYEDSLPWISWSLESPDAVATARHEAIHHLRNYGFFKEGEWDTLSRAARDGDWVKQYHIDERYSDQRLSNSEKLEEAIADAYKNWARGKPAPNGVVHAVFERIKEILESIKTSLKEVFGKDLSAEELFRKVEEGEVGSREPTGPLDPRAAKFEQGDIPDIGGKEAEKLRERISELRGELSVAKGTGQPLDPAKQSELMELRERLRSTTSGTFNMTVDQYNRYMKLIERRHAEDLEFAQKQALEQQRKTQTKEWKANRTEMRDTVREELEGDPNLAVDQLMTSEKVKFHPDALTDEQKAMLPKEYIQKKDGINPDDVAGYFGYASGDALVERLALTTHDRLQAGMTSREWLNHLIDSETDRRMEQTHGNLDQKILEEAKDQAISQTQLDLLHEEVLYLGIKAGSEFPVSKSQLRAWNKELFDKTNIADISTDEYLRIAGKAGKAAEMSLLEEDFANAFREKQRQNNAMIMANYAKQYEKARKSFDRTAKTFQKREVPSVGQEWTNWVHDILQRTGSRVNRSVQDLTENIGRQSEKTLREFIEAKEAETYGERETPVAEFLQDPSFRSEMGKLTAEQFYDLKQSIDVLAKQGRDEKKIYAQGESADRNEVLKEMREKLQTFPKQLLPDERGFISEKMEGPKHFQAGLSAIPMILRRWERADPRGIFSRYIAYPLRRADNYQNVLQREVSKSLADIGPVKDGEKLVDAPFPNPLNRTEANPEGTPWVGFTRNHVLGMLAHAGNRSNWRVLARGYSTSPEALMQWLVRNTTKEDWAQAQKRGDLIFKSLIAKSDVVYEHITGATVEKIPLEKFDNEHGSFDGWYHPLKADPLLKEVWVEDKDTGTWKRNSVGKRDSVMDEYGKSYATTANGYTKKRSGAVYPLDLDISSMNGTINQMIHDISHRQAVIEVEKIFSNRAFQAEVTKHYGAEYTELLEDYIRDQSGAASLPSKAWQRAGKVAETIRQNTISTYIGFNVYTALKHGPTALIWSSRVVGAREFLPQFGKQLAERLVGDPIAKSLEIVGASGYAEAVKGLYARSPELGLSMSDFAMKHSEELQRRVRHWQDTIAGETQVLKGESTFRETMIEKGSWLVAESDMLSAKPTWIAEFNKRQREGISFGESITLADDAVVRAHGTTGKSNQPAYVRGGGPAHGFLISVYGFMGNRLQRMIEIGHTMNDMYHLGKEGELKEAAKQAPKLLADIMTFAIWPIIVEEAIMSMNTEDHRTAGTYLASALTMGMASSVLYFRDIVHGLAGSHDPGVGLLSSAAHDLANAVRDLKKGKEAWNKQHAGKTVGDLLTVLGIAKGVSPKEIGNLARFGIDTFNNQQHPKSAVIGRDTYFRGLTRGTSKIKEHK